ncbi:MAG: hypothetical protein ACJ73S_12110 [Mycobacteriales bacterium]|jgi:hypothetical protein
MTARATLETPDLEATPGTEAMCDLRIRNVGDLVEAYRIEVVGDSAPWARIEPDLLSLYPGSEGTVRVTFAPPRSATVPAGPFPYGVRVTPTERPEQAVVPEGVVQILPFQDTSAELSPRTSRGRGGATHEIAVDNRGNIPLRVGVSGTDPDGRLKFTARPAALTVLPGEAAFSTLRVKPRRRHWRGQPVTMPFQAAVVPEGAAPVPLDGTFLQEPLVPKWLPRLLAALLAILLALAAIWFLLLRPTIRSTAKNAIKKPVAQASKQAAVAQQAAKQSTGNQQQAQKAAGAANQAANQANPGAPPPAAASKPLTQRLDVAAGPGATANTTFTVKAKTTLILTDLVMENPQGDTGQLDLVVSGKTLFTLGLANFRDEDYHFVTAIEVPAGDTVVARTKCQVVGVAVPGDGKCHESVILNGSTRTTS